MLRKFWDWAHSSNLLTWIGHGVQGFIGYWVCKGVHMTPGQSVFSVGLVFGHREANDIINARLALGNWPTALKAKGQDGYFDLWAALAGAALAGVLDALL